MLPNKSVWSRWDALKRTTYIAQVLAPLTLLVTVAFSYLTWREAHIAQELTRLSQEQERSFFIAQNPPRLELTSASVLGSDFGPILFLSIKNIGDSSVRSPCTEIHRLNDQSQEVMLTTNCTADDPYADATLLKGQGVTYHIPQKGYLEFTPKSWIILNPEDAKSEKCESKLSDSLLVGLRFKDILGQPYRVVRQIILCG